MNAGAVCASGEIFTPKLKLLITPGKLAEFTEIQDYRLIQLHPISLSFHLTVEHREMRI